jgi:TorA maturation chaperone TorD
MYRVLASAFLFPTPARLAELSMIAGELLEDDVASRFPFYPSWSQLLRQLAHVTDESLAEIGRIYGHIFEEGVPNSGMVLRESHYLAIADQASNSVETELLNRYINAGLSVGAGSPVPADHISVQLEYLSVVCEQEAISWGSGDVLAARRSARVARAFLRKHLCWWMSRMEHHVTRAAPDSWYTTAASTVNDFAHHERDFLNVIIECTEGSRVIESNS